MNDARKERLLREVLGSKQTEVPFPERTIASIVAAAFVLVTITALTPARDAQEAVAYSAMEARAAAFVHQAPSAGSAEGNVQDMTY